MDQYANRPRSGTGAIMPEKDQLEFTPPDGLDLEGDSGTASVEWERRPSGKVCITAIDGVSVGDKSYGPKKEMGAPEPDSGDDQGAMMG